MTAKQALLELVTKLPEERAAEILQMAQSVLDEQEREDWRGLGLRSFARAYGDDEPDYTEADIRPEKQ
jgi:hypothetical protein